MPENRGDAAMFNILSALLAGLIVGVLARWFYPGAVDMTLLETMLLGVGGSLFAGLLVSRGGADFNRAGCLASVVGAMLLIFAGRTLL
ncbi:putative membrane protein YeaQ/YmgE (transglycosylase-associated protein family) [Altererythrobacter atlanticus]|uniref:GlsB/YeaQ/YmgE family stress response membrane protein n=1 Tax=Croceibacterium atlanticum TaxID=1267766 RepID=UPI001840E2C5|nr:GlsB/YeaQ/YmgE family stress response membrane protein [Croceibacterium atlanticum]MBB5732232.1 putative membrane protein YeaQ/YmgE (transglycosylase-associated protein family) [Croceibacterium atlanticum]